MLVRAIALSLALLVGGAVIVPLATDSVEAGRRSVKKKKRHYKKYSKKWWRQYRARQKRKRALAAKRRALRLRQLRMARKRAAENRGPERIASARPMRPKKAAVLPSGDAAPAGWQPAQSSPTELQFRVDDSAGSQVGSASISVVGPAMGESSMAPHAKSVGGVSTSALRRDVINRMIRENGWVVNDFQKQIGGRAVYVVVAQSQSKSGGVQSRMFYFTEVDGRIYNVATNSPVDQQERLAEESEKVLDSLQSRVRGGQPLSTKE